MAGEKFYLNAGQRYIYEILPRRLTLIAARRFGKTDGVQGPYLSRVAGLFRVLLRPLNVLPDGETASIFLWAVKLPKNASLTNRLSNR